MDDYYKNDSNIINENNRYIGNQLENPYQNSNEKLTNSENNQKNSYKNLIYNMSHKYKSNFNAINTEQNNNPINEKYRKNTIDSVSNSYTKSYLPTLNKYNSKVIVENIRQQKDLFYLLDNFIMENNYQKNYDLNQERDKIIITFYDEQQAFEFTKLLNNYKHKNSLYKDMRVNLALTPNDYYNKNNFGTIKKRGISTDTIQRLFQGVGGVKREKKQFKKKLNILIHSPFYSLDKDHKIIKKINKEGFKDYNRYKNHFPIRVLDSDYKPLRPYNFRSEEKTKWVSPTNFLI